ncbi:MAG: cob(I)yrinic acid a,c-diamide adenosyltransferase [Candidatus Dormibacteraeota bacterium]|nr:cob(I)yrinic acid a,c-diamide adenosyltransferase [Candidatus Dormibacteraeota bacterium]
MAGKTPGRARRKSLGQLAATGDDGTTGLLGGGRAAKDDPRIEAFGTLDEASSALGLARALAQDDRTRDVLEELQRGLYRLGAEMATNPGDAGRFGLTTAEDVAALERTMAALEALAPMPTEFILPGASPASGALDLARAIARRAERRCVALARAGGLDNPEVVRYLNRLSLMLFVLGRYEEARSGIAAKRARTKSRSARAE